MENYLLDKGINCFLKKELITSKLIYGKKTINKPKISIIIPTYKRINLLKCAIDSALNQIDYNDYEVIVGDNGSTFNETSDVDKLIKSYSNKKLFYYKHYENLGALGNWNRLIELATGEYVLMLHDDDWIDCNFLKAASDKLVADFAVSYKLKVIFQNKIGEKHKKAKLFFRSILSRRKFKLYANKMIFHIGVSNLSTFYRRDKLIELGGYNDEHHYNGDNMLLIRYVYNYGGIAYKKSFYNYRILDNDTMIAAKDFPKCGLLFRENLIKQIYANKIKLQHMKTVRSLFEFDISLATVKRVWGCDAEDLLAESPHRKEKFYKLKLFFYKCLANFEKVRY